MVAALLAGSVDWVEAPAPDSVPKLKSAGMQIVTNVYPHIWPYQLSFIGESPIKDLRVRKALNLAIDREGLVNFLVVRELMAPQFKTLLSYAPVWLACQSCKSAQDTGRHRTSRTNPPIRTGSPVDTSVVRSRFKGAFGVKYGPSVCAIVGSSPSRHPGVKVRPPRDRSPVALCMQASDVAEDAASAENTALRVKLMIFAPFAGRVLSAATRNTASSTWRRQCQPIAIAISTRLEITAAARFAPDSPLEGGGFERSVLSAHKKHKEFRHYWRAIRSGTAEVATTPGQLISRPSCVRDQNRNG
jgi:hypothetical protein